MAKRPASDPHDAALRDHLVYLLSGGGAYIGFDKATRGIPADARGKAPRGLPYSPWQVIEHLRLAQSDILEFSRDRDHVSPTGLPATGRHVLRRRARRHGGRAWPRADRI